MEKQTKIALFLEKATN